MLFAISSNSFVTIGFEFHGNYGDREIPVWTKSSKKVYKTIKADGETLKPKTAFENDDSAYFFTYTIRNMDGVTASDWTVTPYYITEDDTRVTGTTATYEINP